LTVLGVGRYTAQNLVVDTTAIPIYGTFELQGDEETD
jgi:hypothetical protein